MHIYRMHCHRQLPQEAFYMLGINDKEALGEAKQHLNDLEAGIISTYTHALTNYCLYYATILWRL